MQGMARHTMGVENKGIKAAVVTNEEMLNLGRARGRQSTNKFIVQSKGFGRHQSIKASSSYLQFGNGSHGDNGLLR